MTSRGQLGRALLVAGVLLFGLVPAASAVTIDFEDRPDPDIVNADYSSQGVTFNGPVASNYGPGFAHSGTKAIKGCTIDPEGCSFATPPPRIRADFTSGQTTVGVWVGNQDASNPKTVRLTAFDDGGNEVGHEDVTMPASAPVNNHLTVTAGGPTIRALEVSGVNPAGIFDLIVDDVEFSTAGPPPPCNATGPPTVGLTQPINGSVFHNNQILLRGLAFNRGAPITEATVVSQGSTTRTAQAFPTPIDENGGSFAINMNGLLQPGNQKIFVTATNCAGTGVSAEQTIAHDPLPPTTTFTQLSQIEVTQTVQSTNNPVPLIAGGPNGTKRTIARVYLSAGGGAAQVSGVSGRLTAIRPDGTRPGGPLTIDSLNTITVAGNQTLDGARSSLNNSLNFELPPEWVTEGRVHLQIEQLKIEGSQTTFPCEGCDNPLFGSSVGATVTFHRVPPLNVWLVGVPYTADTGDGLGTRTFAPRAMDFNFIASWLRRAYPASDVQITQAALPDQGELPGWDDMDDDGIDEDRPGFLCGDINDQLSEFAQTIPAQPRGTRYYGVVADAGAFMRGCGGIGGNYGSGPAGDGRWAWDPDGTYTDWYAGHEIGHLFDRKHPDGGCDDSDDDGGFPFAGGSIGNFVFDNQGIDVGDTSISTALTTALFDWRPSTSAPGGWTDIMTYCDNEWLSSYTYNGILRNLCGKDKANCPNHAQLTKAESKGAATMLSLRGTLNISKQKVTLEPMSALRGLTPSERPKRSDYEIVLRDSRGRAIATYPVEPKEVSDQEEGPRLAMISEVVPFSKKAKLIEIVRGERSLASRRVSANAPTVKLRSPKGKRLNKPVTLRWTARDVDGGRPLSTLQYAADGKRFVTVAAGLTKRKLKVDPAELPGGKKARFRVVVTDGVLTGIDKSKKLKVAAKAPRISIATPVDGATIAEGQSVQLVASVQDDQDARLGDEVVWTSDVQGELGRGVALTTTLQPGAHRLTVSVTNSLGMSSSAAVNVTVEATPPTVAAQLLP